MFDKNPQHSFTNLGITIIIAGTPSIHWLWLALWVVALFIGTEVWSRRHTKTTEEG